MLYNFALITVIKIRNLSQGYYLGVSNRLFQDPGSGAFESRDSGFCGRDSGLKFYEQDKLFDDFVKQNGEISL